VSSSSTYGPLAVGDVDADGRADVVAAIAQATSGTQLHVFRRGTTGALLTTPGGLGTSEASLARNVVVEDLDGDTLSDVVVSTAVGIQVFSQTPQHTLSAPRVVPGTAGTSFVAVADLDADGRPDLVQATSSEVAVLTAQADGTFARQVVDATGAVEVEIGDLDGDGRLDLAANSGSTLHVVANTPAGWVVANFFIPARLPLKGIEVADVNGDGRADLESVSGPDAPDAMLLVWRQGADGVLAGPTQTPTVGFPEPIDAADVNGDGRADLVTAHGPSSTVTAMEQRADGTLTTPSTSVAHSPGGYDPAALGVADLTGDGRTDAVLPGPSGLDLLRNVGGPTPGIAPVFVRSAWPADFGSGLPVATTPTVTFARDVQASTVTTSTVRLLNGRTGAGVPATVTYDAAKRTATVRPTARLYDNAPYRLTVAGVKDTASATMSTAYSTTFRTVDLAPAAVGSFTATGALRAATLSWRAPAVNDLDRYVVRMATGSTPPANVTAGTGVYSGTGTSATVTLAQGTTYSFRIWARDRSGRYSPSSWDSLVGTAETIGSSTTSLTKGRSVTLTSTLTRRDTGRAVAGVPVQLYWRRVGSSTWNLTATRTSSSTGAVSFAHQPTASVDYMWVYRGSAAFVGSGSAARRVTVR
jgi:hypothetical protein